MKRFRRIIAVILALAMTLCATAQAASQLRRGSRGDDVKALQEQLNAIGFDVGTADGDFGGKTEKALMEYQASQGLEATGRLDDDTYRALFGKEPPKDPWDESLAPETGIHRYDYFLSDCDWEEANRRAVGMGGWLVGINSLSEYVELQSELLELGYTDVSFWIGAKQERSLDSSKFYWTDGLGGTFDEPIDTDALFGGMNPWALGEPSYLSASGKRELYTRLYYSDGEARWVWDNCDGEPVEGVRQGYIVEYPEDSALAQLPANEDDAPAVPVPTLTPAEEPEPAAAPAAEYRAELLRISGRTLVFKFSTIEECVLDIHYYDGGELCRQWNIVDENLREQVVRIPIYEDIIPYLTPSFTVKYRLWGFDRATDTYKEPYTDWREFKFLGFDPGQVPGAAVEPAEPVGAEPTDAPAVEPTDDPAAEPTNAPAPEGETPTAEPAEGTPGRTRAPSSAPRKRSQPPKVYRVCVVLASDPTGSDPSQTLEILDAQTQEVIAVVHPGESFYLPPGAYIARIPGSDTPPTLFSVVDGPVMPVIQDVILGTLSGAVTNAATGEPMADTPISLELKGRVYPGVTDEDGKYTLINLPPADGLLTVEPVGFEPWQQPVNVGGEVEMPILLNPYPVAAFLGYWHDGSAEADAAVNAFFASATGNVWAHWKNMYIEVAEGLCGDAPAPGTLLNCQDDGPRRKVEVTSEQAKQYFFDDVGYTFSGVSELLVISGIIHADNSEANNPDYDYFFPGWSDTMIDIETFEPVSDAVQRIITESAEQGANPLDDEILRALVLRRYAQDGMDDARCQAALEALKASPADERDAQLRKLLG